MHMRSMPHVKFEILSIPYYIVKTDWHGPTQWHYDHWKAKDTKRDAQKKGHDSTLRRWQGDELYRKISNCRRMDGGLSSISGLKLRHLISHILRQEVSAQDMNNLTHGVNAQGPKPGPMKHRPDFSLAVHQLAALKHQEEIRTRTFPHVNNHWSQYSSSSSSTWWRPREWQESQEPQERQEWQGWQGWQEWQK